MKLYTYKQTAINHVKTGASVRSERNRHGLSIRTMAKQMGISFPYLSDLENGKRHWSQGRFDLAAAAIQALTTTK